MKLSSSFAVAYESNVFVFGCAQHESVGLCYNVIGKAWSRLPPPPAQFGSLVKGIPLASKIYIVCDFLLDEIQDTICFYDIESWSWGTLPPLAVRRQSCKLAAVSGKIYAIGGSGGSSNDSGRQVLLGYQPASDYANLEVDVYNTAEVWDPETREWKLLPEMANNYHSCIAVPVEGRLFVANHFLVGAFETFDPELWRWTTLPDCEVSASVMCAPSASISSSR